MAEEVIPLPASEHAGLLQQLRDSFSEGVEIQKEERLKSSSALSVRRRGDIKNFLRSLGSINN